MADIPVSQNDRRQVYVASAGQTVFAYDFPIYDQAHLKVTKKVAATGVESVLTITTHYTVSGVEEVGGGNVTLVTGAAANDVIVIEGNTPIERLTDYQQGGGIRSGVLNKELDLFTFMVQEVRRAYDRTARLLASVSDSVSAVLPAPVAGRSLKWSSDGLSIVNSDNDPDTLIADATAQANAAATSATAAANSATSASGSATTAAGHASTAGTHATNAANSATAAAASAASIVSFTTVAVSGQSNVVADGAADTLTLAAGTGIAITTDASTDTITITATGGGIETITAGETLAAGEAIYLDDGNLRGGGASKWYKIDTDATGPVKVGRVRGIAVAAITSGNTGEAQVGPGVITGLAGLTAGQMVYASGTAGAMTQTEPAVPSSGTQNAVVIMGRALSATTMQFEPWHDVVFQARNSAIANGSSVTVEHWSDGGARERMALAYLTTDGTLQEGSTLNGYGNYNGNTVFDRSWAVNNSATVNRVGVYSQVATTAVVKIAKRNSAGNYDIVVSESFAHGGTGLEWKTLSAPYAVPASGDYYAGAYFATGSSHGLLQSGKAFASKVNDVTGTGQTGFTESTVGGTQGYAVVVEYAVPVRNEPVATGSETVNGGATDRVTVKFSDTSDTNQDTKTTFYNRTNATRDLIAEVTL